MPYIPHENAATLRKVALKLRNRGISTTTLFHEIYGSKMKPPIGRSTFDKFVDGKTKRCKNVSELSRIWEHLLKRYPKSFEDEEKPQSASMPDEEAARLLPVALAGFFNNGHKMPALQKALAGDYVMWRRDFEPNRIIRDGIRVSKLVITPEASGLKVVEVQDSGTMRDISTYTQHDEGYVFSHREYIYWLTKEEAETCVKLAVITRTVPQIGNPERMQLNPRSQMHLELMEGYVAAYSRTARYPRARIFCRPVKLVENVTYGIIRLDEITDPRAKERISLDFTAEERSGTARLANAK